jgi:hypothetical protein
MVRRRQKRRGRRESAIVVWLKAASNASLRRFESIVFSRVPSLPPSSFMAERLLRDRQEATLQHPRTNPNSSSRSKVVSSDVEFPSLQPLVLVINYFLAQR